jgi:hypothetical protein
VLARNISLALNFQHDYADPRFPELIHYFDPVRKQGGDNTDAVYVGATIDGSETYRIVGDRGTARYFAVTAVERGQTPWGGKVAQTLFGHDLKVDGDGRFELMVGPRAPDGQCRQLAARPRNFSCHLRQFFADWENERRWSAHRSPDRRHEPADAACAGDARAAVAGLGALGQRIDHVLGLHDQHVEGDTEYLPLLQATRRPCDRRHAGR